MFYLHLSNRVKSNQRNNEQQKKIYSNNLTEEIFCLAFIYIMLSSSLFLVICVQTCVSAALLPRSLVKNRF